MKRLIIYSNCQGVSLKNVLTTSEEFNKKYDVKVYTVFNSSKDDLRSMFYSIPTSDTIIYQMITSSYRGWESSSDRIDKLTNINKIRLTNAYYSGCFPRASYMYTPAGGYIPEHDFDVQDMNMLFRYMHQHKNFNDNRVSRCFGDQLPIYDPDFYTHQQCWHEHHLSLARLDYREDVFRADIRVADYIRRNFQKKKLFHTFNHPTVDTIHEEACQVMEHLDLDPNTLDPPHKINDWLSYLAMPIYSSTQTHLDLQFDCPPVYRRCYRNFTPEEEYTQLCAFYATKDDETLMHNVDLHLDKKVNRIA